DVLAAKARLDRIKEKTPPALIQAAATQDETIPDQTSTQQSAVEPNPLYVRLANQLQEVKTELDIRQKEKAGIDSESAKYSHRVEATPKTEQDIAEAQRQTDDVKKDYEDLKNKLAQARLAESLESKQKGSQFVIVDPANYPLEPNKPDKRIVL